MPRLARLSAILVVLVLTAASVADAQRLGPAEKKRPKLAAGADTNDAAAYLQHGERNLEFAPAEAANAFYWAARIDPSSADALYGRSVALSMRRATTLRNYLHAQNYRQRFAKEMLVIDSLRYRALRLDPLFRPKFYTIAERAFLRYQNREYAALDPQDFEQAVRMYLNDMPSYIRGRIMFANGRLDQALIEYEDAINLYKDIPTFRMERARVFASQGQVAHAINDFTDAVTQIKAREDKPDVNIVFYDNQAIAEYSIATLHARAGNIDSAKAAYGRSAAEDLSFFPAHVGLGLVALNAKDSATAVSELAIAADLATDEPYVHHLYGTVLLATGQAAEAIAPLKKAIELEPLYAAPQLALAQALERTNDAEGAKAAYATFLSLAARRDPARTAATQRLTALGGAVK